MDYLEIDTIKDCKDAQATAKEVITTVGDLIEKLSKYDKDLPVIVGLSEGYYGRVGRMEQRTCW